MNRPKGRIIVFVLTIFSLFVWTLSSLKADNISFGIASNLPIIDQTVNDGDIVSTSSKGFFLPEAEYDTGIVGVVGLTPAVSININESSSNGSNGSTLKKYPVISSGNALVNVSTRNGIIRKGDLITTSKTKGVGMKADKSGYVLGSALEDFDSTNKDEIKKINVSVNIHYYASKASNTSSKISDLFKLSAIATTEEPITAFKYIMAALVVIISFAFGFISFGRLARSGVEALGRNPLAAKLIQVGIIINTVITIAIIAAGLVIGLFILRL